MGTLQNQFRRVIEESCLTTYAVGKGAGIPPAVMYRFVSGERDLTLDTASKLADFFGMKLTHPKRPKGR